METEYMMPTNAKNIVSDDYPFLISDILEYITTIKNNKNSEKSLSLLDIIMDYSFKHNISLESIGDAINDDAYFKSFIKKDCEVNGVLKSENTSLNEW